MNFKVFSIIIFLFSAYSCQNNIEDRWDIKTDSLEHPIEWINISQDYYNLEITNAELKTQFPAFFAQASDSLLNARRKDSLKQSLYLEIKKIYGNESSLEDSLTTIFERAHYYYPQIDAPTIYSFSGELNYDTPIAFYPDSQEMIVGMDWFLGSENPLYKELGVPSYLRTAMAPTYFKAKIAEAIGTKIVPFDIKKRTFIDKMIYLGKILIIEDALLPETPDTIKIGYTPEQIEWCYNYEAKVYQYFAEEQCFFSDDRKLPERFLNPAPFSKFFTQNDTESPGKIGQWMGWQICRAYLSKHPEITLQEFINNTDGAQIFKESGYKPMD